MNVTAEKTYRRRFEGSVGIVTGAASGIGAATTARLVAEGARVAAFDIDSDGLRRAYDQLPGVVCVVADVGDADSVDTSVSRAVTELGGLDFLAHVAGVTATRSIKEMLARHHQAIACGEDPGGIRGVVDLDDEEWRRVMSINLDGTFFSVRAALRSMIEQRSGAIVTTSSVLGVQGAGGLAHYSASKGAVRSFTQAVAHEVAPFGIRVNTVAPGNTETPMLASNPPELIANFKSTPLGRNGTADELAATIAFLLSDDAGFITGETCNVNGGMLMA